MPKIMKEMIAGKVKGNCEGKLTYSVIYTQQKSSWKIENRTGNKKTV